MGWHPQRDREGRTGQGGPPKMILRRRAHPRLPSHPARFKRNCRRLADFFPGGIGQMAPILNDGSGESLINLGQHPLPHCTGGRDRLPAHPQPHRDGAVCNRRRRRPAEPDRDAGIETDSRQAQIVSGLMLLTTCRRQSQFRSLPIEIAFFMNCILQPGSNLFHVSLSSLGTGAKHRPLESRPSPRTLAIYSCTLEMR